MKLPSYPLRFAQLAALWGYGVGQPVFSLLKGNPEFLVIKGASRLDTVVFAVVLAFGPPLVAVGLEALGGLVSTKAAALLHVIALWFFGFTAIEQLLIRLDPAAGWTMVFPAVASYAGVIAYLRWSLVRSFLSVSVALPVVGLLLFVSTAPLAVDDAQAAGVNVPSETPVVLVVFDEFALSSLMSVNGSIDAVRYPGFGRLAHDATWYSRATTVYEHTTQAVPAILSGDLPRNGAFPTLNDFPHNLFTLLGGAYSFEVREPVTRLCPVRFCPDHADTRGLPSRIGGLLHDVGIDFLYSALPADVRGNIRIREGWDTLVSNTRTRRSRLRPGHSADGPTDVPLLPSCPSTARSMGAPSVRQPLQRRLGALRDCRRMAARRRRAVAPESAARRTGPSTPSAPGRPGGSACSPTARSTEEDGSLRPILGDHHRRPRRQFRPGGWRRLTTTKNISDIAPVSISPVAGMYFSFNSGVPTGAMSEMFFVVVSRRQPPGRKIITVVGGDDHQGSVVETRLLEWIQTVGEQADPPGRPGADGVEGPVLRAADSGATASSSPSCHPSAIPEDSEASL